MKNIKFIFLIIYLSSCVGNYEGNEKEFSDSIKSPIFVIVGDKGALLTSTDGIYWNKIRNYNNQTFYRIAYGGKIFSIVGNYLCASTMDFVFFNENFDCGDYTEGSIIYHENKFISLKETNGNVFFSSDGFSWNYNSSLPEGGIKKLIYGKSHFVALSSGTKIFFSTNLKNWENISTSSSYKDVIYNQLFEDAYFAVGNNSIITSYDVRSWFPLSGKSINANLKSITSNGHELVAVGDSGKIIYYKEDIQDVSSSEITSSFNQVVYGHNKYVAVGENCLIAISYNGVNWEKRDCPLDSSYAFKGITFKE